ncbi:MAG: hypothetical protein QOD99_633 [Chthoniobacter sp.]|jgi:predicted NUDIX family NTP pyrophosphohydrolase|nr:hypothetical protein [Chthoniobacter sp.]
MPGKVSAGILLFRRTRQELEVLLVHPGGPFFKLKDEGAWTIPKGEALPEEELLERARLEFAEELGVSVDGSFLELGSIQQKGGKVVHAWAVEGDFTGEPRSNTFELEWPPRSGRLQSFPEIDRAEFFNVEAARAKINAAQCLLLDRLIQSLPNQRFLRG